MCSIFRDSSVEATFRPRLPTQEYWNHQENEGSHQATGWIFWTIYKKRKYPADKPSHRSFEVRLIFMPLFITNKDLMFNDMSCSFGILAWTTELPHHDTYIIPLRFLYQNTGHKTLIYSGLTFQVKMLLRTHPVLISVSASCLGVCICYIVGSSFVWSNN